MSNNVFSRKPRKCPNCNFSPIGNILYGYPNLENENLKEDIACGKIVLGGCDAPMIGADPTWRCSNCGLGIFREKDYLLPIYRVSSMGVLNLKRLSIYELNELAGKIIDELGTRDEDEVQIGNGFVEQAIAVFTEEDKMEEELYELETKKEFIEDEIDRIKEKIEELEIKESNIMYEYNIGVLK